jgi:hypothetical protein
MKMPDRRSSWLLLLISTVASCRGLLAIDDKNPACTTDVDVESDPNNCGRCGRKCDSGSCEDGRCPVVTLVATAGYWTYGIAEHGEYVYWTTADDYAVRVVRKADGTTGTVFSSALDTYWHPSGIVVDDQYAYWSTIISGGIYRGRLNGLNPSPELKALGATERPAQLAADGKFLFTASVLYASPNWGVSRFSKGLSGTTEQALIASNQPEALGIAVDGDWVYWTVGSGAIGVWRANKLDGTSLAYIRPGVQASHALAVDDNWVYWHDPALQNGPTKPSGKLLRVAKDGKSEVPIADEPATVSDIALDSERAYWFTTDGRIMSVRKSGSELLTLAVDQVPLFDDTGALIGGTEGGVLAVDETHVYWIAGTQVRSTVK